eukprot:g8471.t1
MMWPRARSAVASLLAVVGSSSFGSAFVPPLASHGSKLTLTSSKTSPTSAAVAPSRTRLGRGPRGREESFGGWRAWETLGATRSGGQGPEDGFAKRAQEEERGRPSRPQQSAVASTASGLAAGAAVVALAALGGFPDLAAAEAPAWVGPTKLVLDPILLYFEVAFVARIILSWYPKLDLNSAPQNLVAWPTEPILRPTRAVIPPAFGVDISPIVWVMICSLIHEILLGQQGILNLMSNK